MNCKDCKYHFYEGQLSVCKIANRGNIKSCTFITDDEEVESMKICYNCKHWIGGGDWGLSCRKNYYNCSSNGFDKACEQFEER